VKSVAPKRPPKNGAVTETSFNGAAVATQPVTGPDPRNNLNELGASEWISETVSVWAQRGLGSAHADARIEREHPAPFSFSDVRRLVRFFTKSGAVVLDPFAGVGSTLKAAALEGRRGIGIELSRRYATLASRRLREEVASQGVSIAGQTILTGDARKHLPSIATNSVDFVATSPPYASILHKEDHKAKRERKDLGLDTKYSADARDLGNITDYPRFLQELCDIFVDVARVLKPRAYAAVVVSDFRQKSRYVMFHSDFASGVAKLGLELRGIKILCQRHKKVYPYGYPYAYVPNIHHQYILIFQNTKLKA
jgi:DNA modification methylase